MKRIQFSTFVATFVAGAAATLILGATLGSGYAARSQSPEEMMEAMKKYTGVGENHAFLERFVGDWEYEATMMGQAAGKGTSKGSWLMDGRWLQMKSTGSIMGMPSETFLILGYDTFKMSFVSTSVGTIDNAMLTAEGDLTKDKDALLMYGTLDEYLSGEHDKMVKYAYRFLSEDEIVMEVHDLPIGEENTKVVEFRFKRKK